MTPRTKKIAIGGGVLAAALALAGGAYAWRKKEKHDGRRERPDVADPPPVTDTGAPADASPSASSSGGDPSGTPPDDQQRVDPDAFESGKTTAWATVDGRRVEGVVLAYGGLPGRPTFDLRDAHGRVYTIGRERLYRLRPPSGLVVYERGHHAPLLRELPHHPHASHAEHEREKREADRERERARVRR